MCNRDTAKSFAKVPCASILDASLHAGQQRAWAADMRQDHFRPFIVLADSVNRDLGTVGSHQRVLGFPSALYAAFGLRRASDDGFDA